MRPPADPTFRRACMRKGLRYQKARHASLCARLGPSSRGPSCSTVQRRIECPGCWWTYRRALLVEHLDPVVVWAYSLLTDLPPEAEVEDDIRVDHERAQA